MQKFLMFCVAVFVALPAYAQTSVNVGLDTSVNLGEKPGLIVGIRTEKRGPVGFESQTFLDSSRKEHGGWKAGQDILVRFGTRFEAIAGTSFRYRDGGIWYKKSLYSVVGAGWRSGLQEVRLLYRHPLYETASYGHVRQLVGELRLTPRGKRFGLAVSEGIILYHNSGVNQPRQYGWFQDFNLVIALGKSGFVR